MTSIWESSGYQTVSADWPETGQHILAQYDAETVIVYQAYCAAIGKSAVEHGRLGGGGFSFGRMSWIKPNFLWMMYRSGWGTKPGQEVTLALQLRRSFFDCLLASAVASTFWPEKHHTKDAWREATKNSDVRLQWDPDHDPSGAPLARRAIQLGLRGKTLRELANEHLLSVRDISDFVSAQRPIAASGDWTNLVVPHERVYAVGSSATRQQLMLSELPEHLPSPSA